MRAAKIIGLGTVFSFAGFVMVSVISVIRSTASPEPSHATGLSAIVGGLIEAMFSPINLLVMVIGFGAAVWVTRNTNQTSTPSGITQP